MRTRYVLLSLILFITTVARAQITPDFQRKLAKAATDSEKLITYKAIYDFYNNASGDLAKPYLEQGLQAFTKTGYKHGQGAMLLLLSNLDNQNGLLVVAKEKGEQALHIFTQLNEEAYIGKAHNTIGNACSYMGNYPEAVTHFLSALKAFESISDTANLINTYLELGAANDFNSNHDKALAYYNRALDLSLHTAESANIVYLYNNIGLSHARKGELDEALRYFEKAELISRKPAYVKARLAPLTNLGKIYNAKGDNKKALEYLHRAEALASSIKAQEALGRVLLEIGQIESNNEPSDISALHEGLKVAKQVNSKRLQADFLSALADAADKAGNYKEEVGFVKQARVLRDSIFNIERTKEIANLQSEYELNRTTTQLAALESAERRNARKKNIIIIIAAILAATLVTLLVFYTRSRRLNKKLSVRENDLKKANAVKDRLFSIIGHDLKGPVGNIPALLNIYRNTDSSESDKEYILNAMEESSTASLETLEKLLSWGRQQIKGNTYSPSVIDVEEIMKKNLRLPGIAAANKNITILNHIPPATRIYADEHQFNFIMRNLVSNAVKFTHSGGLIEISADRQPGNGYITFSVKDNGIGIGKETQQHIFEQYNESTDGTANETGTSIGLILCKQFVIQNGGNIWVKSAKDEGATFSFTIKGNPGDN